MSFSRITTNDTSLKDASWVSISQQRQDTGSTVRSRKTSWGVYTRKIVILALLVVVPILAFTLTIIGIVFVNIVDLDHCPDPDLCPYSKGSRPSNDTDYYVDFPVGRIAFVSSLSSTISFALVAAMMSMYGYVVASQILHASSGQAEQNALPTPYGTSKLIRLLNAETSLLLEMTHHACRKIFRRKRSVYRKYSQEPALLQMCRTVLLLGLAASILTKIADTYLHVTIEAVSVTRLSLESDANHHLSRSLGSWVFDPSTTPRGYKYFFGASMEKGPGGLYLANLSAHTLATEDLETYLLNYTDVDGTSYALLKPQGVDASLDWTGTGYGIATRCAAIPQSACKMYNSTKSPNETSSNATESTNSTSSLRSSAAPELYSFQCNSTTPPINTTGQFGTSSHELWTYEWHKHMREYEPFVDNTTGDMSGMTVTGAKNLSDPQNMTLEESNKEFRNPWKYLAKIQILAHDYELDDSFLKSPFRHNERPGESVFLMACNATVYDTKYTVINGHIATLNMTPSPGFVAGIVSMPALGSMGKFGTGRNRVTLAVNRNRTTPEAFIRNYELSLSKQLSVPLIAQTVNAPATTVQRRNLNVLTRLPKSALWFLVVANAMFACMGTVLALLAFRAASPDVHQVHLRLSTAGLAAQLFDSNYARRYGKSDSRLFRENLREEAIAARSVAVRRSGRGGAVFVALDGSEASAMEGGETLALRHTRSL